MLRFIDVTLRDGGHQNGFNWPFEFVERYLKSIAHSKKLILWNWDIGNKLENTLGRFTDR